MKNRIKLQIRYHGKFGNPYGVEFESLPRFVRDRQGVLHCRLDTCFPYAPHSRESSHYFKIPAENEVAQLAKLPDEVIFQMD